MGKLVYILNMSVDGFTEDANGSFDFGESNDDVFAAITELVRGVGTHLYGRRMYETMAVWETDPAVTADSELRAAFATAWQAADKVVFSSTLDSPVTERTRIERRFDADAVGAMKASTPRDLMIGGPTITAHAFAAGLVDECFAFVHPVVVGGGKPAFQHDARVDLELLDERRFDNITLMHHRVRSGGER